MDRLSVITFRASMVALCCMTTPVSALEAKAMQSMVIVEGDKGRGSAFVLAMDGKVYLVTNSHVIRGNRIVKFKNLRNEEILTRPLEIADKVDAVRAEVIAASPALELEPTVEQTLKIGDGILVAGNAEGEGVVREIPGKVVGIGPDRIEVDAPFVPGNSGSPILLKSTGQVIGVATYIKIPPLFRGASTSPARLNEVRRFGYRLDTVAKWIRPASPDRLSKEGLKLAELDEFFWVMMKVLSGNADAVARLGASAFIPHEQVTANANFAALSATIEEFAKTHKATTDTSARMQNATMFFQQLKDASLKSVEGYKEAHFSGYFNVQFKDHLNRLKQFHDWFDGTTMPPFRDLWLASAPATVTNPNRLIENPLTPERLSSRKWTGGADFWIEFREGGDYLEFWRGGKYPGTWKLIGGKEVHVSRKDGWDYVFTPTGTRNLLRVWKAKPGQERQRDEIFQPMDAAGTGSSGNK